MDAIVFISKSDKEVQEMLDIADEIGNRYRIKFREEKSKVMKIGKELPDKEFNLGEIEIGYCEKYKDLGVTITNKNNMDNYIWEQKRNVKKHITQQWP